MNWKEWFKEKTNQAVCVDFASDKITQISMEYMYQAFLARIRDEHFGLESEEEQYQRFKKRFLAECFPTAEDMVIE